ncbi:hypothetical protein IB277_07310 [Ensifer sp. ENS07]|uniref:hypothetical protein n=1 Tax=Ensifer sp. ENS07 TaxID=2769274 RepID=UPI0017846C14|nr:hypothetical protein [Ensifer sp. ENS07]MBD9636101.1 hypothetical protein [Ensifer sp. ENS07]
MKVLSIKPAANSGGGTVKAIATFDLALSEDVRVYGLRLMRGPDGRYLTYAPNGNGGRLLATFSPALAAQITTAAINELERQATANGTTSKN